MDSLIHADIFFFITSVVTIVLAIFIAIALFYIIKILADIREISRIARVETNEIAGDIQSIRQEVRDQLKKNSSVLVALTHIARGFFRRRKSRSSK